MFLINQEIWNFIQKAFSQTLNCQSKQNGALASHSEYVLPFAAGKMTPSSSVNTLKIDYSIHQTQNCVGSNMQLIESETL